MAIPGGCRCGACRYTLNYEVVPVSYACHCLDCQTMSGAAFTLQIPVAASRLSLEGQLVAWAHTNTHGKVTTQRFCAVCKTRLCSSNEARPDISIVRAGTLDCSQTIVPAVHMWTRRKHSWLHLPSGTESYDEGVPPDRMKAIVAPNFA
jgi:hypothetical protein